jgi:hypothetical protein
MKTENRILLNFGMTILYFIAVQVLRQVWQDSIPGIIILIAVTISFITWCKFTFFDNKNN